MQDTGGMMMKKLRVLCRILRQTRADRLLFGFLAAILACSLVIWRVEPDIPTWRGAIWYCFTLVSTVGFGDVVVRRPLSRILSILLSFYSMLVLAIVTGVVVNYYSQLLELRTGESLGAFLDKLEHLEELSPGELHDLSERVKKFRMK